MEKTKVAELVNNANGVTVVTYLWSDGTVTWDRIIINASGEIIRPR